MEVGKLWVTMGLDKKGFDAGLVQARVEAEKQGGIIRRTLENAISFAGGMALFEVIKQGFKATVGAALDMNVQLQNARIGFETMLGSAKDAEAFLRELQDFAAKTPFEFPDLMNASKRLLAMGFAAKDVLPMMRAVGDAAAGLGLGREGIDRITMALGQMRAKAKVSAEEMLQLTEAGVPAWDILAKAMGKSTAEVMKLSERGLLPAEQAISALIAGMEQRFPNMMKNMENTWQGVTSTIKDVFRITLGDMTSGLFKAVNSWLATVRDFAVKFQQGFKDGGIAGAIKAVVPPEAQAYVLAAVNNIKSAFTSLKEMFVSIKPVFVAFGAALAGIAPIVTGLASGALRLLASIARELRQHWSLVGPVVLGAAAAFGAFRSAVAIQGAVSAARAAIAALIPVIQGVATGLSGLPAVITRVRAAFALLMSNPWALAISAAVGVVVAAGYALYKNWDSISKWFTSMWAGLTNLAGVAVNKIATVVKTGVNFFASAWTWLVNLLPNIWSRAWAGIGSILTQYFGRIGQMLASWLSGISNGIARAWDTIKNAVLQRAAALVNGLAKILGPLGELAKNAIGGALSGIKSIASDVSSAASSIAGKIKSSFASMWGFTSTTFASGAKNAVTAAKQQFTGAIPSLEQAGKALGDAVGKGLAEGTKAGASKAREAVDDAKDHIISSIDRLNDAVIAALRRRYEKERNLQEKALQQSIDNLDRWRDENLKRIDQVYAAKKRLLDDETNRQVSELQQRIDLLDKQLEEEERAKQDREELQRIENLQKKLEQEKDAERRLELEQELNDAILARQERLHKEEIERQKETLRQQIEQLKKAAEEKQAQMEAEKEAEIQKINASYEAEKQSLQQKLEAVKSYYSQRLEQAQLAAEAEKMIMKGNQDEIINLLKSYGNLYEDAGKSLGERIYNGIKSWTQLIPSLVNDALNSIKISGSSYSVSSGGGSYSSGGSSKSTKDLDATIIKAKEDWQKAYERGDKAGMERAHQAAEAARQQGGTIKETTTLEQAKKEYSQKYGTPKYALGTSFHPGGPAIVGEEGPELVQLPRGSQVIPTGRLKALPAMGAVINITFQGPVYGLSDFERKVEEIINSRVLRKVFAGARW